MADAAKESVEIQEREHRRATEVADVRWWIPDEGRLEVLHDGTTDAMNVRVEFGILGQRFHETRTRVRPGERIALPSEDDIPLEDVDRRAILIGIPMGLFPGAIVRVQWTTEHGSPGLFEGERSPDIGLTYF